MDAATGGLRHEAVIPREGEVGDVDVEGGLEEHRALALQVRRTRPEPAERLNEFSLKCSVMFIMTI